MVGRDGLNKYAILIFIASNALKNASKNRLQIKMPASAGIFINSGVDDGARTHDNRNHNPGLYQLSYDHRWITCLVHKCTASEPRIIRGFVESGKCFRFCFKLKNAKKSPHTSRANIHYRVGIQ
jgi:hypothetical protein